MKTQDFDFDLPVELVAQSRVEPYDHSKLLVVDRRKNIFQDKHFYDIVDLLTPNDVLVFNNTYVFKARINGKKENGGKTEILLLEPLENGKETCRSIIKGKVKVGTKIILTERLFINVVKLYENGDREIQFNINDYEVLMKEVDKVATLPLPHYIDIDPNKANYQTVYADKNKMRSIAAPTAGFHFTEKLIDKIKEKGVTIENISLNVGIGTFRPVKTEKIEDHDMHFETYNIEPDVMKRLNDYKQEGRRIIAVGTTSVRTLEDSVNEEGILIKESNNTNIFIYPGFKFKFVDAIITNFHLPQSTLIMLVCAFGGKEKVLNAYKHAIDNRYRFYSFGDSMFIY